MFDTQTDIIASVQETVFINDDQNIIHNDSDIEIGHNVETSVQCGPSTRLPITHTEITINPLCDKDIDDDNDYEDECYDFQDELEINILSFINMCNKICHTVRENALTVNCSLIFKPQRQFIVHLFVFHL